MLVRESCVPLVPFIVVVVVAVVVTSIVVFTLAVIVARTIIIFLLFFESLAFRLNDLTLGQRMIIPMNGTRRIIVTIIFVLIFLVFIVSSFFVLPFFRFLYAFQSRVVR